MWAIRALAQQWGMPNAVLVVAPSNAAARLLGGATIHHAAQFPKDYTHRSKLSEKKRTRLLQVKLIFADEGFLIGAGLFAAFSQRFRDIHIPRNKLPFGGTHFVLLG